MGLNVVILGIDGADKKKLVDLVEQQCIANELSVRRVSWQRELATAQRDGLLDQHPYDELQRLWLGLFELFFADARIDGKRFVPPKSLTEIYDTQIIDRLKMVSIEGVRPASPFAVAWLELAGHTLLYHSVVQPFIAQGKVVIQDSLGLKNVTKSLFMAGFVKPEQKNLLAETRKQVQRYFARGIAPDLGVYLQEEPADVLAFTDPKEIGVFDCYSLFGGDAERTFLELQGDCAVEFEACARHHEWLNVEYTNLSPKGVERAAKKITEAISQKVADKLARQHP